MPVVGRQSSYVVGCRTTSDPRFPTLKSFKITVNRINKLLKLKKPPSFHLSLPSNKGNSDVTVDLLVKSFIVPAKTDNPLDLRSLTSSTMDVGRWQSLAFSLEDSLRKTDAAARTANQTGSLNARKLEFKKKVSAARDGDLKVLTTSLEQYRANPRQYGITAQDVTTYSGRLDSIRALLSSIEQTCRGENVRTKLLSDSNQSRPRRAVEETEETRDLSNRDMLDQQMVQREQDDELLDGISQGLFSLKQIGLEHSKQFQRQDELLTDLHEGVDTTQRKLNQNITSVDKVEKSSRGGCCAMLTMALLLALIVSLLASNWICPLLPGTKKC